MKSQMTKRQCIQASLLMTALLGLLIMQFTGCADLAVGLPEGSAAMKQQALSFTPPDGKAGVYVIRRRHDPVLYQVLNAVFDINLDQQEFGSLAKGYFLFGTLQPGEHTLSMNTGMGGSSPLQFNTEAGKNKYFLTENTRAGQAYFEPLSEADGQEYVRKSILSGDNRFDHQN
jgi:hypothetical protein